MTYSSSSTEIHDANLNAMSLCAKVAAYRPAFEVMPIALRNDDDFISLTDIAAFKTADYPSEVIQNWMRNRSTVEYLGLWERIHNPDFNYLEFEVIDRDAGRNAFVQQTEATVALFAPENKR